MVGHRQRPIHQRREQADDLGAVDAVTGADVFGGLGAPPAAEDRQPPEDEPFRLGQ